MLTLKAFAGATPAAQNWLRLAVDALAENALESTDAFPKADLEAFLADPKQSPAARRSAYEWLCKADPKASERLLPKMLDDPSVDLRRDAVARELGIIKDDANALKSLFASVRDEDQAQTIRKRLSKLGETVDLTEHFNYLTKWLIIGPFDGGDSPGFDKSYPPEKGVDPNATYPGKGGKPVAWSEYWALDGLGSLDLNNALGKTKNCSAYAATVVTSGEARDCELRFGSTVAVRVWLNGKELFAREEFHHGQRHDQYAVPISLKKGDNLLLFKISQNNQTEPWAQEWTFQARICDATGGKVPITVAPPVKRTPSDS